MNEQARRDQPQLCVCVSFPRLHSVDGHEDKKQDEQCQFLRRRNLIFHTPLPNQIEERGFFDQIAFQQGFGSHENTETLQICV
jgi:hypothetical protein